MNTKHPARNIIERSTITRVMELYATLGRRKNTNDKYLLAHAKTKFTNP